MLGDIFNAGLDGVGVLDLPAPFFFRLDGAGNALFGSTRDVKAERLRIGDERFADGQVLWLAVFDRHGLSPALDELSTAGLRGERAGQPLLRPS